MSLRKVSFPNFNLPNRERLDAKEIALTFSSPEPKALGELIGWDSSRRRSVRPSVTILFPSSTLSIFQTILFKLFIRFDISGLINTNYVRIQ